jgi:hypothetical protein
MLQSGDIVRIAQDCSVVEFEQHLRDAFSNDQALYHQLVNARARVIFEFYYKRVFVQWGAAVFREMITTGSLSIDTLHKAACQIVYTNNGPRERLLWIEGEMTYGFSSQFCVGSSTFFSSSDRVIDLVDDGFL